MSHQHQMPIIAISINDPRVAKFLLSNPIGIECTPKALVIVCRALSPYAGWAWPTVPEDCQA